MKYNSIALHSSTAKERCKPRGRIDRNKGKVGNRIKSIAGKPADQPRIRLLVACLPQRQVVYAGSGVRVSHTDAVLPFASLIWPNHGRQPPLEDAAFEKLAEGVEGRTFRSWPVVYVPALRFVPAAKTK